MEAPTVYLDHAATTPMTDVAIEAMTARLREVGNASSLHASGRRARRIVEESRETLAQALGCRPGEVVFTSGGTEADNLAVKGLFWSRRDADPARTRVLASAVEHHAVLDPLEWLEEHEAAAVELVPVDGLGRLRVDALAAAIERDPGAVAMLTVMWANNEVGTLQPIDEVVDLARLHGIPVHTDAVQAIGVRRPSTSRRAAWTRSRSPGTRSGARRASAPSSYDARWTSRRCCTGAARSATCAAGRSTCPPSRGSPQPSRSRSSSRPTSPRGWSCSATAWSTGCAGRCPTSLLNGDPVERLPGNVHLSFPGCDGDSLLMLLDARRCRVLHRLGVLGGRPAALPRAAGDGPRRRRGTQLAAVQPRPHQHRGRRRRRGRRDRSLRGAGPRGRAPEPAGVSR